MIPGYRNIIIIVLIITYPLLGWLISLSVARDSHPNYDPSGIGDWGIVIMFSWIIIFSAYFLLKMAYPWKIRKLLNIQKKISNKNKFKFNTIKRNLVRARYIIYGVFNKPRILLLPNNIKTNYFRSIMGHILSIFLVNIIGGIVCSLPVYEYGWFARGNGSTAEFVMGLSFYDLLVDAILWAIISSSVIIFGVFYTYYILSRKQIFLIILTFTPMFYFFQAVTIDNRELILVEEIFGLSYLILLISFYIFGFFGDSGKGVFLILAVISLPLSLFFLIFISCYIYPLGLSWSFLIDELNSQNIAILGAWLILILQAFLITQMILKSFDGNQLSNTDNSICGSIMIFYYSMGSAEFIGLSINGVLRERIITIPEILHPTLILMVGVLYFFMLPTVRKLPKFTIKLNSGHPLLVLRVFGHKKTANNIFDNVVQYWRATGPVFIISGYEVAMRTITPKTFYLFVRGQLHKIFFDLSKEVKNVIRKTILVPYEDSLYPVNDVYCHDNSWKNAFNGLLDMSSKVVLDMRHLAIDNEGLLYELKEVVSKKAVDDYIILTNGKRNYELLSNCIDTYLGGEQTIQDLHIFRIDNLNDTVTVNKIFNTFCAGLSI